MAGGGGKAGQRKVWSGLVMQVGLGSLMCDKVGHGTVRFGMAGGASFVAVWFGRVRWGLVWQRRSVQARFDAVWCDAVRSGSEMQVGLGSAWCC